MALTKMGLLISPEACIGCRGCQAACKSWNILPAEKTVNLGSYENPKDLMPHLYNKIHYVEAPSDKDPVRWLFISQRCMHCEDAGCMKICPSPGALYRTKEGAVGIDKDKCIGGANSARQVALSTFHGMMKRAKYRNAISVLTGLHIT